MLAFNFEKRISAADALKHPYFSDLYDSNAVIYPPSKFDFSFERNLTNSDAIKKECYKSVLGFHGIDETESSAGSQSVHSEQAGASTPPKTSRSQSSKSIRSNNTSIRKLPPGSSTYTMGNDTNRPKSKGGVKMKLVAKINSLFGRWKPK